MKKVILSVLLLSAFAVPADANWFNNPIQNINRNIGSAPNPTPEDLRAMRTIMLSMREQKAAAEAARIAANKVDSRQPAPAQGGAGNAPAASPSR